ncbi:MAG: EAL domain-containing protein [Caulobacteraceae bacterium]|jgi:EAL domain-containing protein (putative c-di-GMP-specific phosphodiesterase class I)|nr:EAL domain-containing protein [Caulobacteraceae bacterium]
MNTKSRLLGMAFAAADTLLELDAEGRIHMTLGAGPRPGGAAVDAWSGLRLTDLVGKSGQKPLADALAAIRPNERPAPIDTLIVCDADHVRRARLRLFQLPDLAPAVSCAISYEGAAFTLAVPEAPTLLSADGLLNRVRGSLATGQSEVAVAFVDIPGLDAPDEAHQRAAARVAAVLQASSIDGASAARLAPERFALVRPADCSLDIEAQVRDAGAAEGVDLAARTTQAALSGGAAGPSVRALRFALEACIKDGGIDGAGVAFSESLKRTLREAERFRAMVKARDFTLEYQPIVDLSTGVTHHFEALARFGSHGPADSIRLAEELGLIEGFDLAVAEKALMQLRRPGFGLTRIAVNVSGASLGENGYVDGLLRLTAAAPEIRSRLLIEVTETAAVADIEAAGRRLTALRRAGIRVCLDDFGVGAASLDYLHRLPADTVKIDGRFVREITTDQRARDLVSHLVEMCADLKMTTIAEMVETEAQAAAIRELGVGYGQGWLFGRPALEPVLTAPEPVTARRRGAVAGWG